MSQTILQDTARQPADATAGTLGAAPANERAVYAATQLLRPTGLDEVSARVELLTRVDRKYFVPVETFREFTALLEDEFAVLDIDGRRMFGYESVYFDTPDLATYRAHLQGRRRRFKLRTRTYVDSGACMLEVKLKGPRAITVKMRTPHPHDRRRELTPEALASGADFVHENYGLPLPDGLGPVLTTTNSRATFASRTEGARFTCDIGLICRDSTG